MAGTGNDGSAGNIEYLDISKFEGTAGVFKDGTEKFNNIKKDVKNVTTELLDRWEGEGKEQFFKDYKVLYRQLEDIGDVLYDLYDKILNAAQTYSDADDSIAKNFNVDG